MSKPNADLLYKTLDLVIAAEPDGTWDQNNWIAYNDDFCGTTACFAGHTLLAQGGKILTRKETGASGHTYIEAYAVSMPDGRFISASAVAMAAQESLRLTYGQADDLFHADRSIAQLKEIVDEIAAGTVS